MVEKAREVGAKADVIEHLRDKLKESIDVVVDTEARNVMNTHGRGKKGSDYLERLKFSIREMFDLMSRGAEVHPALMEPTRASELFPDVANLNSIPSKVQEIAERASSEADTPASAE